MRERNFSTAATIMACFVLPSVLRAASPATAATTRPVTRVLYLEGYPRWEYRHALRELMREDTVAITAFLFSGDIAGAQFGNRPIPRVPQRLDEFQSFDAIIVGDVDRRLLGQGQLKAMAEFVTGGGGLAMIAGPRFPLSRYAETPLAGVLPVDLSKAKAGGEESIAEGFRPLLTAAALRSPILRIYEDPRRNEQFLSSGLQPIFWHCRGITARSRGQVLLEHPTDKGPDERRAPLLVAGTSGKGRTLFCAFDESWRWRSVSGQDVHRVYWLRVVQYLATRD